MCFSMFHAVQFQTLDPGGSWGLGPPCPQDLFKIMEFSGNVEEILGAGPPGVKTAGPLTKILDPPRIEVAHQKNVQTMPTMML